MHRTIQDILGARPKGLRRTDRREWMLPVVSKVDAGSAELNTDVFFDGATVGSPFS
jgi:hypothetical protein